MTYCISIFCLPQEIDDLELTLTQLKKAFRYIDEKNFILADQIRNQLLEKGVQIEDKDGKTSWKFK